MHTRLLSRETIAEGTMCFRFEKPEGFSYMAGQSLDWTLIDPAETDEKGNTRPFSLVSAPHEDTLALATRMRDTAFKRVLKELPEGSEVLIEGPFGDFTLHENAKRPAILLAGGIGVTPFRSMIADAALRKLPHQIVLFYSNRRPEDAAFIDELAGFEKLNPNYRFIGTMTAMERSSRQWDGERGLIDAALLARHLQPNELAVYYLAGPAPMVAAMRQMLSTMGVSKDDIRTEEFSGY